MIRLLLFTFTILIPSLVCGQSIPYMKFGKPLEKEVAMTQYDADTSASAVVLVDYGESKIVWNQSQGFQIVFDRYTRIKIIDKEGYDWADISVSLYHNDGSHERISAIKGYTYNLENGQIKKEKLDKSAIFEEQASEHWVRKKFTMPNVKQGSVIEYSYTITSDFLFQFRDWNFQHTIPVAWSEYKAAIPEYFDYKQISQGYLPMAINEHETSPGTFSYTSSNRSLSNGGNFNNNRIATSKIEFVYHNYRWAVKDAAAFKEERFMTSLEDHLSKIRFELAAVKYPNSPTERIMDTWETLDRKLMENDYFGDAIKKDGFIKDQVENIVAKSENDLDKLLNVYSFVQNKMKWNGKRHFYVESNLKSAFEKGEGNAADINLLLVAMLRRADLDANPVILSTRDHGQVLTYYPILSRFNYVIVEVMLDGKQYLLDATDKYCPNNTLPYRALNSTGRRISHQAGWVDLTVVSNLNETRKLALQIKADGTIEGTMVESNKGYTAANLRDQINESGKDKFAQSKFENQSGWILKGFEIKNLEDNDKPLVSSYDVSITESAESLGNLIYVNPIFSEGLKENPFKIENRQYPVDMGCPYKQTYLVSLTIPEGYTVDELPESMAMRMPDGSAIFRFNIQQTGNNINVTSQIIVKKAVYNSEEYPSLKQFFNSVVDTHNQQIVLKKS